MPAVHADVGSLHEQPRFMTIDPISEHLQDALNKARSTWFAEAGLQTCLAPGGCRAAPLRPGGVRGLHSWMGRAIRGRADEPSCGEPSRGARGSSPQNRECYTLRVLSRARAAFPFAFSSRFPSFPRPARRPGLARRPARVARASHLRVVGFPRPRSLVSRSRSVVTRLHAQLQSPSHHAIHTHR